MAGFQRLGASFGVVVANVKKRGVVITTNSEGRDFGRAEWGFLKGSLSIGVIVEHMYGAVKGAGERMKKPRIIGRGFY